MEKKEIPEYAERKKVGLITLVQSDRHCPYGKKPALTSVIYILTDRMSTKDEWRRRIKIISRHHEVLSVPRTCIHKDLSVHVKCEKQATEYIISTLARLNNQKNAYQQLELVPKKPYVPSAVISQVSSAFHNK